MTRRTFAGLEVVVENPAGSVRTWHDRAAGRSGATTMRHDYGYLVGHQGSDGEEVDCYLGPDEAAPFVYVVHQLRAPDFAAHDEDKCLIGFASEADAKAAYLAHRDDGDRAYSGMSAIPIDRFKAKLERRTGDGKIRHEVTMPEPIVAMRVEHRGSKWVVLPEAGDKVLGTHDTKAEAEKQLAAIEASKARSAMAGSHLFDLRRGDDGRVRTGVWDFLCVEGWDRKDGQLTEFTPETLGQMIDNAVRRGDPIPYDWNHQTAYSSANGKPAPALAYAGAWAVVWDGAIVKQGCARGVEIASLDGLDLSCNGLWVYRSEVTDGSADYPLGQQILPGFKLLSPMFTSDGKDRQGNPVGYQLIAIGCTNSPHQGGTELNLEGNGAAGAPVKGHSMDPKMLAAAKYVGLDEKATPAEIKKAFTARAVRGVVLMEQGDAVEKMGEDEKDAKPFDYEGMAAKMEEAAKLYEDAHFEEETGGEPEHVVMRKMAAKFRHMQKLSKMAGDPPFGGKETPSEEAAEEKAKMAKLEAEAKDKEKGDVELAAFAASLGISTKGLKGAQIMDAIKAATVPASKIPDLVSASVKSALEAEKTAAREVENKQKAAVLMAALPATFPGDRGALQRLAERDPAEAMKLAQPFLPASTAPAHLFDSLTRQGGPIGGPTGDGRGPREQAGSKAPKIHKGAFCDSVSFDEESADAIKALAFSAVPADVEKVNARLSPNERDNKALRLIAAGKILETERPQLFEQERDRNVLMGQF